MTQRVVVRDRTGRAVQADPDPAPPVVHDHPIHQLMVIPCQVHHADPGAMDEYGDHPLETFTTTDEHCYLWQSQRAERDELEREVWQVAFKPDVAIDANDAVTVRGQTLQVFGAPWVVVDPVTGWDTHIEATIRRHV